MKVVKQILINEEFNSEEDLHRHFDDHVLHQKKEIYHLLPKERYPFKEIPKKPSEEELKNNPELLNNWEKEYQEAIKSKKAAELKYEADADALTHLEEQAEPSLSYLDDNSIQIVGYIRKDGKHALYKRDGNGMGEMVIYSDYNPSSRISFGNHVIVTYYMVKEKYWEQMISGGTSAEGKEEFESEFPHNIKKENDKIQLEIDKLNQRVEDLKKQQGIIKHQYNKLSVNKIEKRKNSKSWQSQIDKFSNQLNTLDMKIKEFQDKIKELELLLEEN